ncbi:uncharacterized protein LOC118762198 [Octopus sinensis]|uniref:Uncharacterized protein LOC118762198 n=1 Tax=Octopus sinensis TaxID=2607531 RepID=A0A7E6EPB2_9MOLL|nr:uncharacterized protein LOC118762198 [Octopus sinensis]
MEKSSKCRLIVDLGYITEFSKEALKSSKNDLEKALNLLNKYDGILPPNPASPLQSPQENTQEQDMKEKEVLDNFRKILPRDSEDYLDFLLIEESQILSDYLSLLEHV